MKIKTKKNKGFSLIEIIIYIALCTIILTALIQFSWDVIYGRVKSQVQLEVNQNLRFAVDRIAYEIRNSKSINSITAQSISLNTEDLELSPTIIELNNGRVSLGQGTTGDCSIISPCSLTSNQVTVTDLFFNDLSFEGSSNVRFGLTVTHNNPANKQEWDKTQSYQTSIEMRGAD